jgi:hypothetical protein
MESRANAVFFALLLLVGMAGAILVIEEHTQRRRAIPREEFQRLVGGVGFGPALDLSGCANCFDPRLDGSCEQECGPIPGGACFCPRHAGSVFFYPPLDNRTNPEPWN